MFTCDGCGARYAQWLSRCYRCQHTPLTKEPIMAKITRHNGVTDARREPDADTDPDAQPVEGPVDTEAPEGTDTAPDPSEDSTGDDVGQGDGDSTDAELPEQPAGDGQPVGDTELSAEQAEQLAADGHPVLETPEPEQRPQIELPPANALKSAWADTLIGAGVSGEWVAADGRTKDQMVEMGRGLNDGTYTLDSDGTPVAGS